MGGGCYKEREREGVVSHCHSAGDDLVPPEVASPVFVFGHNHSVGISSPSRSDHPPRASPRFCTACLVHSSTALPLPAFPRSPVHLLSRYPCFPIPSPALSPPSPISIDLQISNPIHLPWPPVTSSTPLRRTEPSDSLAPCLPT